MLNKYKGSSKDLYVWNDMNEPSVFNGPEVRQCNKGPSLCMVDLSVWTEHTEPIVFKRPEVQ